MRFRRAISRGGLVGIVILVVAIAAVAYVVGGGSLGQKFEITNLQLSLYKPPASYLPINYASPNVKFTIRDTANSPITAIETDINGMKTSFAALVSGGVPIQAGQSADISVISNQINASGSYDVKIIVTYGDNSYQSYTTTASVS